jgi:hypothetical protein
MPNQSEPQDWGLCVDCRFWQIETKAIATHQTAGVCLQPELRRFRLRVTGNSGCQQFEKGETARGEGSSLKPPPQSPPEPPLAGATE